MGAPYTISMVALPVLLAGCALSGTHPDLGKVAKPAFWEEAGASTSNESSLPASWWQALHDPVLDHLMPLARFASVEQALARVDEARAQLGQQSAATQPQVHGGVNVQRGIEQADGFHLMGRAGPSLQLNWEIDLWGRLAYGQRAAEQRSFQRAAEAELAQLLAQAELAELVHQERTCRRLAELGKADQESWTYTLHVQQERLRLGALSPQGFARQQEKAATQRAQLSATEGQCRSLRHAVRALVGLPPSELSEALALEQATWTPPATLRPEQPASLLLRHPQLRAASAAADAAAQDLGAAQAARLPSLSLSALLSHQWLRVLGMNSEQESWSVGTQLSASLWDGGANGARVDAAHARLRQSIARLDQTLRQTVRDVESALARQHAAQQTQLALQQQVQANLRSWQASQQAAAAGRLSPLDLEDAARQHRAAEQSLLTAQRDLSLAWIGVVKAAGHAPLHLEPSL